MIPYNERYKNHRLGDYGIKDPITGSLTVTAPKRARQKVYKMETLRDKAKNYKAPETLNIADLEAVQIDHEIKTKVVNEGTPKEFSYDYMVINDEEYRVPKTVQKQIKALLEKYPDMVEVQVLKSGTTKDDTVYNVQKVA